MSFPRYLYQETLSVFPEPFYVVCPSTDGKTWKVEAIHQSGSMASRKLFPQSWRGFLDGDERLKEITGVPDAIFSHRSGFYMAVGSKEGAIALAQKALVA
jgi:uncharacterized UPF0160 family protein